MPEDEEEPRALSQDEIDALFNQIGGDDDEASEASEASPAAPEAEASEAAARLRMMVRWVRTISMPC